MKRHQKDHCHGPAEEEEEEEEQDGEEEQDDDEEEVGAVGGLLGVAEALGLVNEVDQSLLGARRRTGVWRVEEEQEEDDALRLQDQLTQQGLQVTKRCPLAGKQNISPLYLLFLCTANWLED